VDSEIAATVAGYADKIMAMIANDRAEGMFDPRQRQPRHALLPQPRSFSDLHDWVDANEYLIHAEVPYDPDSESAMDLQDAVCNEVTRRLERQES
jgi:hypothetical protein